MTRIIDLLKKLVPKQFLNLIRPPYHYTLALMADYFYKHPSKEIIVIGVTGTKGKSTVTEVLTRILEAEGYSVASLSTIQFRIGKVVERNMFKMSMPGRFFIQKFFFFFFVT